MHDFKQLLVDSGSIVHCRRQGNLDLLKITTVFSGAKIYIVQVLNLKVLQSDMLVEALEVSEQESQLKNEVPKVKLCLSVFIENLLKANLKSMISSP